VSQKEEEKMKVTLSYIKNLLREAAGDESCPAAAQDKRLNKRNKRKAAANPKIRYGHPKRRRVLSALAKQDKFCGNCAAFNISEKMIQCNAASSDGSTGYCMMHEFTCAAEKTCLTWAPGGPKRN
jgi:hypothetical protein